MSQIQVRREEEQHKVDQGNERKGGGGSQFEEFGPAGLVSSGPAAQHHVAARLEMGGS